jgi:hypothetical protein
MVNYLTEYQISSQLRSNRPIEQWIKSYYVDDVYFIKYIKVLNDRRSGCYVWISEVEDVGDENYIDVYSFPGIDPDEPEGFSVDFESIEDCLQYCYEKLGAKPDKFVGSGMIQDIYRDDYLKRQNRTKK